jgi:hypothetical protein
MSCTAARTPHEARPLPLPGCVEISQIPEELWALERELPL